MVPIPLVVCAAILSVVQGHPLPRSTLEGTEVHSDPRGQVILLQVNDAPVLLARRLMHEEIRDEEDGESAFSERSQQPPGAELVLGHGAELVRSRRSTQPGAGGGAAAGGGDRGHVEVGVSRGEGGGRRVEARGEGNVWQSRDGRGRVDVHGHYSRDYGGRHGTGRPQYGAGVRYSHRFR